MNSPQDTRQFLRWYQEGGEYPSVSLTLPDWFNGRVPQHRDRSGLISEEPSRMFVPLEDYDIHSRMRGERLDQSQCESTEQARQSVEQRWQDSTEQEGMEAFAWYVPFHFSRDHWGIYIDEAGVQLLGSFFYLWSFKFEEPSQDGMQTSWSPGDPITDPIAGGGNRGEPAFESLDQACKLAKEVLLRHEWYHHQVELLASHLEDIAGVLQYEQYHTDVYRDTFASEACIEESLANAYVYRSQAAGNRAPSRDVFHALFHRATKHQPTAYQNYHHYLGSDFQQGGQYLGYMIQNGHPTYAPQGITDTEHRLALGANLPFTTGVHRPRNHQPVPIYVSQSASNPSTLFSFRAVPLETDLENRAI